MLLTVIKDKPIKPNEFQEVLLHCIGKKKNAIVVVGTGRFFRFLTILAFCAVTRMLGMQVR